MARIFKDLARNYTTTTGTGPFVLGEAVAGFKGVADGLIATGDTFYYSVSSAAGEHEVGVGTMQADGSIARAPVGAPTNFSPGEKVIALVVAAQWYDLVDDAIANLDPSLSSLGARATTLESKVASLDSRVTALENNVDLVGPTITSASRFDLAENNAFSLTLTAAESVTWAKTGGADAALFSLSGNTLTMAAKDFEAPVDSDKNNDYVVQITAYDATGNPTPQTITVNVTNVAEGTADTTPPTITSPNSYSVDEGKPFSATATANETVTWSKTADATAPGDVDLVTLNTSTGAFSIPAQDFETKPSVKFNLIATDAAGNPSPAFPVTINILDVAESVGGLTITSPALHEVAENTTYSATATASEPVDWFDDVGPDAAIVGFNNSTAVWTVGGQSAALKPQVLFTLRCASKADPNIKATQDVTLTIKPADGGGGGTTTTTFAITSPNTFDAPEFDPYSQTPTANQSVTSWSLGGTDAALVSINNSTGQWTVPSTNRIDGKLSYSFTLTAKNSANETANQTITVNIVDAPGIWPNDVSEFPHQTILDTDVNHFTTADYIGIQSVEWDDPVFEDNPAIYGNPPYFVNAYRYTVNFDDSKSIIFDMDIDYVNETEARNQLNKIANALGRVPALLRNDLYRVCGMLSTSGFASADERQHRIKISNSRVDLRISQGKLPMTMLHECGHASNAQQGIDDAAGNASNLGRNYRLSDEWKAAKDADAGRYVVNYSTKSDPEDFATSQHLAWAVIYHPTRFPQAHLDAIKAEIPNRIEFFRKVFAGTQTVTTSSVAITSPRLFSTPQNSVTFSQQATGTGVSRWDVVGGPDRKNVGLFNDTGKWAAQNYSDKPIGYVFTFALEATNATTGQKTRQTIEITLT